MPPPLPKSDLISDIKDIVRVCQIIKDAEDSSREVMYRIQQGLHDINNLTQTELDALGVSVDVLAQAQNILNQFQGFLQNTVDDRYRIY